MEQNLVGDSQRFVNYCHERGINENEAVIAMTVACHFDNLQIIEKRGIGIGVLNREPSQILQDAGVMEVIRGKHISRIDWERANYYLELAEKLRR